MHWYSCIYTGPFTTKLYNKENFSALLSHKYIKNKEIVDILIPSVDVKDPATHRKLIVYLTGRYFFIGTNTEVMTEKDIGFYCGNIVLLRTKKGQPKRVTDAEIAEITEKTLAQHKQKFKELDEIIISQGSLKNWTGFIIKINEDTFLTRICSDAYVTEIQIPIAICQPFCR